MAETIVRKTANQSITSTTFVDVTDMSFAVAANTDYIFRFSLQKAALASGDVLHFGINGPASPVALRVGGIKPTTATALSIEGSVAYDTAFCVAADGTFTRHAIIEGVFRNGVNAGTLAFRCKVAAAGDDFTIFADSYGTIEPTTTLDILLQAAISGSAIVSADLRTTALLQASVAVAGSVAGALTTEIALVAAVSGTGAVAGALTTEIALAAAVSGSGTVAGALTTEIVLAAAVTGTATVAADLFVDEPLRAAISGSGTVAGALTTQVTLAASIEGAASVASALTTEIRFVAAVSGIGATAGALETAITLQATPIGTALVAGALTTQIVLQASVAGAATAVAVFGLPPVEIIRITEEAMGVPTLASQTMTMPTITEEAMGVPTIDDESLLVSG